MITQQDIKDVNITITLADNTKDPGFKATARVDFSDNLSVKGIRIRESKFGGYWVAPPSYKIGDKFKVSVAFRKDIWNGLKERIIEEYEKTVDDASKNIVPEEIF